MIIFDSARAIIDILGHVCSGGNELRNQLEALMRTTEATALATASIADGRLNELYTFGEIQADTIWTVASLTKPVFAYGVMLLVEQGLIELDRPLQTYLPSPYADDPVFLPHMTARHALSHTTGFQTGAIPMGYGQHSCREQSSVIRPRD